MRELHPGNTPLAARSIQLLQLLALDADKSLRAVENAPADGFCEGNPLTEFFFETALIAFWGCLNRPGRFARKHVRA